jgi:transketolase
VGIEHGDGRRRAPEDEGLEELTERAQRIRRRILEMVYQAQSGHIGGSLSAVELLVALYFRHLRHDPANPAWPERDRFLLSKGHATPVYYAVLAEAGYFPVEELATFRRYPSRLQGHPSLASGLPGVEINGGSLGHGLGIGLGMALSHRLDGNPGRIYVLLGDGEVQEGEVWESAMAAAHFRVDNLVAILDYNRVQQDGPVSQVMEVAPLAEKWRAFGWAVREIDGHDLRQVLAAYRWADGVRGQPAIVIAHTVKGKGVSFMEGQHAWHGKAPKPAEYERALAEIGSGHGQD